MSESRNFARGSKQEHGVERVSSTLKKGKFQGEEEGKQKGPLEKEESVSGLLNAQTFQEDLESLADSEVERRLEDNWSAHKITRRNESR